MPDESMPQRYTTTKEGQGEVCTAEGAAAEPVPRGPTPGALTSTRGALDEARRGGPVETRLGSAGGGVSPSLNPDAPNAVRPSATPDHERALAAAVAAGASPFPGGSKSGGRHAG